MRLSRLVLAIAAVAAVLVVAACGDGTRDAVDQARSQARSALDESGLRDQLDQTRTRVDDALRDADDAGGGALTRARERAERVIRDARARVEREIREARDDGATDAEIERLREEARTRLDDLRDRVDDALGP
jgi:ElaB/YqjD/DUF883 family membrane-anchored ribosome-binding protein